jgi:hypothetical protein
MAHTDLTHDAGELEEVELQGARPDEEVDDVPLTVKCQER